MERQEIFDKARKSIVDADEEKALELVETAREEGLDLLDLLINGFGAGNDELGENFDKGIISLPELIYAAEVMKSVREASWTFFSLMTKKTVKYLLLIEEP